MKPDTGGDSIETGTGTTIGGGSSSSLVQVMNEISNIKVALDELHLVDVRVGLNFTDIYGIITLFNDTVVSGSSPRGVLVATMYKQLSDARPLLDSVYAQAQSNKKDITAVATNLKTTDSTVRDLRLDFESFKLDTSTFHYVTMVKQFKNLTTQVEQVQELASNTTTLLGLTTANVEATMTELTEIKSTVESLEETVKALRGSGGGSGGAGGGQRKSSSNNTENNNSNRSSRSSSSSDNSI